ncbi:hypothetical protein RhiirA4_459366 [Rhizophagus irregularis]|uniref:Uncharacterized protein n=1 Tax=Rhizophagus irregularis TaxID=588596 RepID=A0A2I1GE55_9GLOM|nr:hypothetical protein RhiirA4_459366 [Rhizophagus irregularis]
MGVCVTSKCLLCYVEIEYHNEKPGDDFSKYFQEKFFQGLWQAANISVENALEAACEKLQNSVLGQANGEFIFNREQET